MPGAKGASSQGGSKRRRRGFRFSHWLWNQRPALKFTLLVLAGTLMGGGVVLTLQRDPGIHANLREGADLATWFNTHGEFRTFVGYFLVALPLFLGLRARYAKAGAWALVVAGSLFELGQIFVPTRVVSAMDLLYTWLGVLAALLLVGLLRIRTNPWKERMKERALRRSARRVRREAKA